MDRSEIEARVIAGIFKYPGGFSEIVNGNAELWFSSKGGQWMWDAMRGWGLDDRGKLPSLSRFLEQAKETINKGPERTGITSFIYKVSNSGKKMKARADLDADIQTLKATAAKASMTVSITNAAEQLIKKNKLGNVKKIADQLILDLHRARGIAEKQSIIEGDWLENYDVRSKERKTERDNPQKFTFIPTGIPAIDDRIGGLPMESFGLIASRTGIGKSLFLGNIIWTAYLAGYNVILYSIEMNRLMVETRLDSLCSGVDSKRFLRREFEDSEERRVKEVIDNLRSEKRRNKLWIVDVPGSCSMSWIDAHISSLAFKPNLVVTDYAGDMFPSSAGGRRLGRLNQEAQGEIAIEHQDLARKRKIAVWTAQQLNREGQSLVLKGIDPGNENIGRSDMYGNRASVVIILAQDKTMEQHSPPLVTARIAKGRIGGFGTTVNLEAHYPVGKFIEVEDQKVDMDNLIGTGDGEQH